MTEYEFAVLIRRMLLNILSLIERRYSLGKYSGHIIQYNSNDSIADGTRMR